MTSSLEEELRAVREDVGIFAADSFGQIAIGGPDSASFLHRMLSNEVQRLPIGEGRYQGLLDRKGMLLSLFYLICLAEQEFLAVTPPQLREKTALLLQKMKFIEKVAVEDRTPQRGLLSLVGPRAKTLKKDLPGGGEGIVWTEDTFGVPWINFSGPTDVIRSSIAFFGKKIPSLSEATVRLVKMAAGFPEYGVDIDETHILLETLVPVAHQRNKGCYPGQEVIERISAYGKGRTPKRLCTLTLDGERLVEKGADVLGADGQKAGSVTSSAYNPLDRRTVILAYLDHKYAEGALQATWDNGRVILN